MAKDTRDRPWLFAVITAWLVFAVASVLPLWMAWRVNAWEGLGELGSFWAMLASVPRTGRHLGAGQLLDYYGPEMAKLVALLAVAFWVGWRLGRRREGRG